MIVRHFRCFEYKKLTIVTALVECAFRIVEQGHIDILQHCATKYASSDDIVLLVGELLEYICLDGKCSCLYIFGSDTEVGSLTTLQ